MKEFTFRNPARVILGIAMVTGPAAYMLFKKVRSVMLNAESAGDADNANQQSAKKENIPNVQYWDEALCGA